MFKIGFFCGKMCRRLCLFDLEIIQCDALSANGKIATDAGESVMVFPVSSIDVAAVAAAIRSLDGEVVQVVTEGRSAVRARLSYSAIRKLAERGDVRRIERDDKK